MSASYFSTPSRRFAQKEYLRHRTISVASSYSFNLNFHLHHATLYSRPNIFNPFAAFTQRFNLFQAGSDLHLLLRYVSRRGWCQLNRRWFWRSNWLLIADNHDAAKSQLQILLFFEKPPGTTTGYAAFPSAFQILTTASHLEPLAESSHWAELLKPSAGQKTPRTDTDYNKTTHDHNSPERYHNNRKKNPDG